MAGEWDNKNASPIDDVIEMKQNELTKEQIDKHFNDQSRFNHKNVSFVDNKEFNENKGELTFTIKPKGNLGESENEPNKTKDQQNQETTEQN